MHDYKTTKGLMEERKSSHIVEQKLMIEMKPIFILENLEPLISSTQGYNLSTKPLMVQYIEAEHAYFLWQIYQQNLTSQLLNQVIDDKFIIPAVYNHQDT
jgi:hypothetical protein